MTNKKNKGFTLIELISVLVILAILALIVTPLVLNIIRKARVSADKRSIDAYGRSIELAVAGYLLDTGTFPTSMNQLTVEYKGDEVVCTTTQIKNDSSVYLAGCTVGGRNVDGYTYGTEEAPTYKVYTIGDEVTYNNVNYYVIADSDETNSSVTLLKAEPLTVEQVNTYGGVGTANNHVNMYATSDTSESYYQTAYDQNGYGGMQYYSSATCGNGIFTGCTTDYAQSEVKYVVDAWKNAQASQATEARLITLDELTTNFKYEIIQDCGSSGCHDEGKKSEDTPEWIYGNYRYYTNSVYNDSSRIWAVDIGTGKITYNYGVFDYYAVVRPVITISKSELN